MVGDGDLPVFDVTGHPRLYAWTHVTTGTNDTSTKCCTFPWMVQQATN